MIGNIVIVLFGSKESTSTPLTFLVYQL